MVALGAREQMAGRVGSRRRRGEVLGVGKSRVDGGERGRLETMAAVVRLSGTGELRRLLHGVWEA